MTDIYLTDPEFKVGEIVVYETNFGTYYQAKITSAYYNSDNIWRYNVGDSSYKAEELIKLK